MRTSRSEASSAGAGCVGGRGASGCAVASGSNADAGGSCDRLEQIALDPGGEPRQRSRDPFASERDREGGSRWLAPGHTFRCPGFHCQVDPEPNICVDGSMSASQCGSRRVICLLCSSVGRGGAALSGHRNSSSSVVRRPSSVVRHRLEEFECQGLVVDCRWRRRLGSGSGCRPGPERGRLAGISDLPDVAPARERNSTPPPPPAPSGLPRTTHTGAGSDRPGWRPGACAHGLSRPLSACARLRLSGVARRGPGARRDAPRPSGGSGARGSATRSGARGAAGRSRRVTRVTVVTTRCRTTR